MIVEVEGTLIRVTVAECDLQLAVFLKIFRHRSSPGMSHSSLMAQRVSPSALLTSASILVRTFLSHSQSYWEIYSGLWDTENIYQLDPLQIDGWQRRAVQHSISDIDQH